MVFISNLMQQNQVTLQVSNIAAFELDYVIFLLKLIYENIFTVIKKIAKKLLLQMFNLSGLISFKFTRYTEP